MTGPLLRAHVHHVDAGADALAQALVLILALIGLTCSVASRFFPS